MLTTGEISKLINGVLEGDAETLIYRVKNIENADVGSLSFIVNEEYARFLHSSEVSAVIVHKDFIYNSNGIKHTLIRVDNVYTSLAKLLNVIENDGLSKNGISDKADISPKSKIGNNVSVGPFSVIEEDCVLGDNVVIGPNATIGKNVTIGENTKIYAGVRIYHDCIIGSNCILHANSVIGSDGFGFKPDDKGNFEKIPHVGIAVIEDNVEVGANTVIDRATFGETRIRKNVKLDNLIQIAHNVEIGSNTVIAALTGVAGSTKIGKNVMIGGQSGFAPHIKIADGSKFQAQSGVNGSIKEENKSFQGSPAIDFLNHMKSSVVFKSLPQLQKKVLELEKILEKLKNEVNEAKND